MTARLITAELEKRFSEFPLYKQDGFGKDAICVCCFYIGNIRWYVLEGQHENNDFIIFGIVIGMGETEYGYASIKEMEEITIKHPLHHTPLHIEQHPSICNVPIGCIDDKELKDFLRRMEK